METFSRDVEIFEYWGSCILCIMAGSIWNMFFFFFIFYFILFFIIAKLGDEKLENIKHKLEIENTIDRDKESIESGLEGKK